MRDLFFDFLVQFIGAFVVWLFKGCKGKLSDEMAGPYDSSSKTWRNFAITLLIFLIGFAIVFKIGVSNSEVEKKTYEIHHKR